MAATPALATVPELTYESMTGEELAVEVAALTGKSVEDVKNAGVQNTLVALHLSGEVPEDRHDLNRLSTGESFVRPTAFTRVRSEPNAAGVLVVDVPLEEANLTDWALASGLGTGNQTPSWECYAPECSHSLHRPEAHERPEPE